MSTPLVMQQRGCMGPRVCCLRNARRHMVIEAKLKYTRKIAQNAPASGVKASRISIDADRLITDPHFEAVRQLGPVKSASVSGRGRVIVATQDISAGEVLLVSKAVGPVVSAAEGSVPNFDQLTQALLSRQLSTADRLRVLAVGQLLGLSGCTSNSDRTFDIADLGMAADRKAQQLEAPPAAPKVSKGFGAQPKAVRSGKLDLDLSPETVAAVVQARALGNDTSDRGVAILREEEPHAYLGLWPEYAALGHSCAPNTQSLVIGNTLQMIAVRDISKNAEVTTNYLHGNLAAFAPLQRRTARLTARYGLQCNCVRCTVEKGLPADISDAIACIDKRMFSSSYTEDMQKADIPQLQLELQERVDILEALLAKHALPEGEAQTARASVQEAYTLLFALTWTEDSKDSEYVEQINKQRAQELAIYSLVAPASENHLLASTEMLARCAHNLGTAHPASAEAARACLRTHILRYGMVSDDMLKSLIQARSTQVGQRLQKMWDRSTDEHDSGAASAGSSSSSSNSSTDGLSDVMSNFSREGDVTAQSSGSSVAGRLLGLGDGSVDGVVDGGATVNRQKLSFGRSQMQAVADAVAQEAGRLQ